jgi:hypothetical protein
MKKVLGALVIALAIPGMLSAAATMGMYFGCTPGSMTVGPAPYAMFDAYLYLRHADQFVTAIEYSLITPDDPGHAWFSITDVTYPDNKAIHDGDPFGGHSIAYWPPINGYGTGYNLICSYRCATFEPCWDAGGAMVEYDIVIGPHPKSGFVRGTFAPDNEFFYIEGLSSLLCPEKQEQIDEEKGWVTIQSMY